jgi:hypothetical protein
MERIFVYSGHLSDDIPKKVRIDKNQSKPQPANNKSSCVKTPRSVFGIFRVDTSSLVIRVSARARLVFTHMSLDLLNHNKNKTYIAYRDP